MIDVTFVGAHVRPAATAVVIDVLRATSTITVALASGYERVLVAGSVERALELRAPGRALAGERECVKPPGFDVGNSPGESRSPLGAELVIATTNGAPALIGAAAVCDTVYAASLLNLDAVVETLATATGDILIVCAGTDGNVTLEDVYLAGRICAELDGDRTDAARVAEALAAAYANPLAALEASAGSVGILAAGLDADIAFCAQESIVDTVPRLVGMLDDIPVLEARASSRRPAAEPLGAIGV